MSRAQIEKLVIGKKRRIVFVVDDLVEPSAMRMLYRRFRSLQYSFIQADSRATGYAKHLAHHFPKGEWQTNPVVQHYLTATESVLRDHRLRFRGADRIYANLTLFGDYNFSHYDACDWTAVAFLNERWQDHWGGEIVLYRDSNCDAPAISIRPKPGRLVIFDGSLLHRAGTPTKYCLEPRITLATKIGERRKF